MKVFQKKYSGNKFEFYQAIKYIQNIFVLIVSIYKICSDSDIVRSLYLYNNMFLQHQ